MITLKVSDGPCCRHPLLIVQESICHFEKFFVDCLHICEHDGVVKVVAIVPLQVASLTKNVSNGRLLHEGEGRELHEEDDGREGLNKTHMREKG